MFTHLESKDFTWRVQCELRGLLDDLSQDDGCMLRKECERYYARFRDCNDLVYNRLLEFCEEHPEVLLAPGYAERHGWIWEMREELCNCIRAITHEYYRVKVVFKMASLFSKSIPPHIPTLPPRRRVSLHLSLADIPEWKHSGLQASNVAYDGLFDFVRDHPCVLTPDADPHRSFSKYHVRSLQRCLLYFNRDDSSLLYLCATQFVNNFPESYFDARFEWDSYTD